MPILNMIFRSDFLFRTVKEKIFPKTSSCTNRIPLILFLRKLFLILDFYFCLVFIGNKKINLLEADMSSIKFIMPRQNFLQLSSVVSLLVGIPAVIIPQTWLSFFLNRDSERVNYGSIPNRRPSESSLTSMIQETTTVLGPDPRASSSCLIAGSHDPSVAGQDRNADREDRGVSSSSVLAPSSSVSSCGPKPRSYQRIHTLAEFLAQQFGVCQISCAFVGFSVTQIDQGETEGLGRGVYWVLMASNWMWALLWATYARSIADRCDHLGEQRKQGMKGVGGGGSGSDEDEDEDEDDDERMGLVGTDYKDAESDETEDSHDDGDEHDVGNDLTGDLDDEDQENQDDSLYLVGNGGKLWILTTGCACIGIGFLICGLQYDRDNKVDDDDDDDW